MLPIAAHLRCALDPMLQAAAQMAAVVCERGSALNRRRAFLVTPLRPLRRAPVRSDRGGHILWASGSSQGWMLREHPVRGELRGLQPVVVGERDGNVGVKLLLVELGNYTWVLLVQRLPKETTLIAGSIFNCGVLRTENRISGGRDCTSKWMTGNLKNSTM
ncbi:hypothetical protein BDY19DRAFT_229111 [Irpex rosettiformis]|uniref:Uncharacterized protein n=1 Tax=Irpex rosettiformis TaxID=378272 RepID=A0ACB8U0N0_9APHY|nr:hypothetical protein BDY19DRAFT_229111 [Irpex rosettiformis]